MNYKIFSIIFKNGIFKRKFFISVQYSLIGRSCIYVENKKIFIRKISIFIIINNDMQHSSSVSQAGNFILLHFPPCLINLFYRSLLVNFLFENVENAVESIVIGI